MFGTCASRECRLETLRSAAPAQAPLQQRRRVRPDGTLNPQGLMLPSSLLPGRPNYQQMEGMCGGKLLATRDGWHSEWRA